MKSRDFRQTKRILRTNRGTTMVEVLVAVMVVMIVVVMFGKVISASVSLYQKADRAIAQTEKFDEAYYKTENIDRRVAVKGADGADLTLILKEKKGESPATIKLPKARITKYTDGGTGITRYQVKIK